MGRNMEKTYCRYDELPKNLFEDKIRPEIEQYTTALLLDGEFAGSGTFVRCNEVYGILTARHIPHNPKIPSMKFNFKAGSSQSLGLVITKDFHSFNIPMDHLKLIDIEVPSSKEYGPDISFIKLLSASHINSISTRKSFFNIADKRNERLEFSLRDPDGVWMVVCCPSEFRKNGSGEKGFDKTVKLGAFPYVTGINERYEKNGYDYIELDITYKESKELPESFKGTSGAGVWKILLKKKPEDNLENITFDPPVLSGLVFYQTGLENNKRRLRCHGGKTIYKQLYEALR